MRDRFSRTCLDVSLKGRDIGTGAERTPSAGDDDSAHGRVQLDTIEGICDGGQQLVAEGIQLLRPIECQ
jgi:hypothetical protein